MDKIKEKRDRQVQIRLTPTEYKLLEQKAEEDNRTVSNLVRTVLLNYINQ